MGGAFPAAVAFAFGDVWFTQADRLWRLDESGRIEATISLDDYSDDLAAGPDALWVRGYSNTVTRVDPRTNEVAATIQIARDAAGTGQYTSGGGIAADASGAWVSVLSDNKVWHIDPTATAARTSVSVGARPIDVTTGGEAVYVVHFSDGTVSRIDETTERVVDVFRVGGAPARAAFAAGRLWIAVKAG
jgi:YVTN family beta-propeller protein